MNIASHHKSVGRSIAVPDPRLVRLARLYRHEALSRQISVGSRSQLPHLVVMTDDRFLPDPTPIIPSLPPASVIIIRDYFENKTNSHLRTIVGIAHHFRQRILIAGDPARARRVNADGVHLPSWMLHKPGLWKYPMGFSLRSAACHNVADIRMANRAGIDFVMVSPVLPTRSHPGALTLGIDRLRQLAREAEMPVLGLGGINHANASQVRGPNIIGVAGISMFQS